MYITKDDGFRRCEEWETRHLDSQLIQYAALDVFASRWIFEHATEKTPLDQVEYDMPPGTQVAILVQEGGDIAAYGEISEGQPNSLGGIRVKVPSRSRLVININTVLIPSAAAILHLIPQQRSPSSAWKTKPGAQTLAQLQAAAGSSTFQVVVPLSLLDFDYRKKVHVFPSLNHVSNIYYRSLLIPLHQTLTHHPLIRLQLIFLHQTSTYYPLIRH